MRECDILDSLAHPNVMKLFGVCIGDDAPAAWPDGLSPPCICCELLCHGTFIDFLTRTDRAARATAAHWLEVVGMLLGAARGLGYLSGVGLVSCVGDGVCRLSSLDSESSVRFVCSSDFRPIHNSRQTTRRHKTQRSLTCLSQGQSVSLRSVTVSGVGVT